VCVLDDTGRKATAFVITHTADGFDQLVACLRGYGDPAGLPVAIERPDGRLVDRLLEAGHPVVSVQPNAIKAWRDAEVLSGAKNDPGDAALIAEYLRLRQHRLRVLAPFSAQTRALAAVVRTRDDLIDQRVAAANQLGACLDGFWPGAKAIFADLDLFLSSRIAGLLGWFRLMVLAVPGKPLQAGLLQSGLAGLADRRAVALVLVVRGHIADLGVQPHPVVALPDQCEFGAQHRRVWDLVEVGPFGLDVAEQRPRSRPGRSGCRAGRSAGGSRTRP
jgi:transposase